MALKFSFRKSKNILFDAPYSYWFLPIFIGLYPFLFYYSNNFASINSLSHLRFFIAYFFGIPLLVFALLYIGFKVFKKLGSYKSQILFVTIIVLVCTLMSYASYLTYKKKALVVIFIISVLLAIKLHHNYKKLIVIVLLMTVLPVLKNIVHIYDYCRITTWLQPSSDINEIKFVQIPNVYMIQPDGYVNEQIMGSKLYGHKTDFFDWLRKNEYKVYDNFRSNYLASLSSNSSMFAMKHHYYGGSLINSIEVPKAREAIIGESAVIKTFKNNGYKTFFVVEDEYFQQNKGLQAYDYYNINQDEIPSFCNGNMVKKVVFEDLKIAMNSDQSAQPKFFFVEKLLPHHVHFNAPENRIEAERKEYLEKIDQVTIWLKMTIEYIEQQDPNAIVIVLADHGGWVGMEDYEDMFTTKDEDKIFSIFAAVAAIKWNGLLKEEYDKGLKSNVNIFRVLFSVLSENKKYLENLEDNSSYNLGIGNSFYKEVYQVIDDNGKLVYNKY